MKSTASEPGLSKVNLAFLSAQVLSREIPSPCVISSCSCSSDNECSTLTNSKCECPCTSALEFFYCRSQFPNSRLVNIIQSPFILSQSAALKALFNSMRLGVKKLTNGCNLCFLQSKLRRSETIKMELNSPTTK